MIFLPRIATFAEYERKRAALFEEHEQQIGNAVRAYQRVAKNLGENYKVKLAVLDADFFGESE